MKSGFDSAGLLRTARRRAGLSQRELARRARTAQSVVARIEQGRTSPAAQTLERLLHAAGFRLSVSLEPRREEPSHMLEDVARILALTPEDRLREVGNASRFIAAARRA